MRSVLFILVLAIGYDGFANDFNFVKSAYRAADGMFASVTGAM